MVGRILKRFEVFLKFRKINMDIIVSRGKTVQLNELKPFSIALDGFVLGPEIDAENHRFSFDHHSRCLRYCTISACMQAWCAVCAGLDNLEKYTIYANDVDADVCVAVWCLKNSERCKEPLVKKLVDAVGWSDMMAGAFGYNGMTKVIEWICAPETDSKRKDDYNRLSDEGLNTILEAVLHRIDLYVNGESGEEPNKRGKHGEHKILRNENDWVLVESHDPHISSTIYQMGFDRLVKVRPLEDSTLSVTIAKRSDFVSNFPLQMFYEALNKIEPPCQGEWNGSSSIGGSPRNPDGSGTRLTIEQITETIDKCLEQHQSIISRPPSLSDVQPDQKKSSIPPAQKS